MRILKIISVVGWILAMLPFAGCSSRTPPPVPGDSVVTSSSKATLDAYGRDPSDPRFGWMSIDEPFGDDSSLDYQLTPQEVVIGQPVRLEVHTKSSYGPITEAEVMVRTTTAHERNDEGFIVNPRQGNEWMKVAPEGVYVNVEQNDGSSKNIRYEPGDAKARSHAMDDPGWTRFVTTVTPTSTAPVIELRWHTPAWDNDPHFKSVADQAIQVFPPLFEP